MSTFHLPIQQEWLSEGRTLEKAELHTGSCEEQERICLAKWPGPQSPKCDGAQREILQHVQQHRKAYHTGSSNGNEKLKYGQIMLWKSLAQWLRDWKRPFFKEKAGKRALSRAMKVNKAESSFRKRLQCSLLLGKKSCTCIVRTRRPVSGSSLLSLTALSHCQE